MAEFTNRWFYTSIEANDANIDFDEYANELQHIYEELDDDGYDVVQVVPMQSPITVENFRDKVFNKDYIGDIGFSVTRGAVVIGKKRSG